MCEHFHVLFLKHQGRDFVIGTELVKLEEDVKADSAPFYSFGGFEVSYARAHTQSLFIPMLLQGGCFYCTVNLLGSKAFAKWHVTNYHRKTHQPTHPEGLLGLWDYSSPCWQISCCTKCAGAVAGFWLWSSFKYAPVSVKNTPNSSLWYNTDYVQASKCLQTRWRLWWRWAHTLWPFLFQFSFDKAHETNILFHVREKYTRKKIDSSLNGNSFYWLRNVVIIGCF